MKRGIILSVCIILLFVISFRILVINEKYPDVVKKTFSSGEVVLYNSFELTVADSYLLDEETVNNLFEEEMRILGEYQCVVVDLHITNRSTENKKLDVYTFILETGAAKNGINLNTFYELNSDDATLSPTISSNEKITLKLPFHFTQKNFTKNKWDKFNKRNFKLVLNLYPQKVSVSL